MSDSTYDQLRSVVDGVAHDLEVLVAAVNGDAVDTHKLQAIFEDHGVEVPDWYGSDDVARDVLMYEWPLEIVQHGQRAPGGEWETTHCVVVFSTGGPHVELDTSACAVVGYWHGSTVRRGVNNKVVDFFEEWCDL